MHARRDRFLTCSTESVAPKFGFSLFCRTWPGSAKKGPIKISYIVAYFYFLPKFVSFAHNTSNWRTFPLSVGIEEARWKLQGDSVCLHRGEILSPHFLIYCGCVQPCFKITPNAFGIWYLKADFFEEKNLGTNGTQTLELDFIMLIAYVFIVSGVSFSLLLLSVHSWSPFPAFCRSRSQSRNLRRRF